NPFKKVSDDEIQNEIDILHKRLRNSEEAKMTEQTNSEVVNSEVVNSEESNAAPQTPDFPPFKEAISYDDFAKLDLRIATVLSCKPVKGAYRLLEFELEVGQEKRAVVSG